MQLADAAGKGGGGGSHRHMRKLAVCSLLLKDIRTQQQKAASSHIHEQLESTTAKPLTVTESGQRLVLSEFMCMKSVLH